MEKIAKVNFGNTPLGDCPKCAGEDSMYAIVHMKWSKERKWYRLKACSACGFEAPVN